MSGFERPGPDLGKIVDAWGRWVEGSDVLPGRTMADLKIGGVDKMLETVAADTPDAVADLVNAWSLWERGKVGPGETLASLVASGFGAVVEELAEHT